jgi:hypothetical protein
MADRDLGERTEIPKDQKTPQQSHLHALRMTAPIPFGNGLPWGGALVGFGLLSLSPVLAPPFSSFILL